VHVPSLNDRRDDIPLLAEHFMTIVCEEHGIARKSFSKEALDVLKSIDWTGNIRELRNIVERLIILGETQITDQDVVQYANKK
jgi:DNA-binding NtrC family response regulator